MNCENLKILKYHFHKKKKADFSMGLIHQNKTQRYGQVIRNGDDRVTAFKEKSDDLIHNFTT
jgi:NDP-sugar pyrophosphorylase family protein